MRMIASVGSWIVGSGTSSTRTSLLPCQTAAFMDLTPKFSTMFGLRTRAQKAASACPVVTFAARSLESMDRKKAYFLLMGTCILLILLAWNVVRFWSTTAAVVMSVVAAVIPPVAVIVGNWGQDRQ